MKYLLLILISALLCSPIGPFWVLNFGSAYVPELLIFPLAFFWLDKSVVSHVYFNKYIILLFFVAFCFLMLMIGWYNSGGFSYAYSDFRASLLFFLMVIFFSSLTKSQIHYFSESVFSIAALAVFFGALYYQGSVGGVKNYYPFMLIPVLFYFSYVLDRPYCYFIAIGLALYICLFSFYRSSLVITFFSLSGLFFLMLRKFRGAQIIGFLAVVLCFSLLLAISWDSMISFLEADESRYIHSIGKWEGFYNSIVYGEEIQGGDDLRADYMGFVLSNFFSFLMPFGFGYKSMVYDIGSVFGTRLVEGNTIDSAFLFAAVHFGTFFLLALIFGLLGLLVHVLSRYEWHEKAPRLFFFFAVVFYFSITGVFFTEISGAIFTSVMVGLLLNDSAWG